MIFVELTPFVAFRELHWTDDDFRRLQEFLLASPLAGDLIRGGGGLRKIPWSVRGRGKRGGARVIYYWHVAANCIYLVYGYTKSNRDDLTTSQMKVLRTLLKDDLTDG
jgi:mRNA-degrading endonuclease RelE of RelBE toxin-antitoxin system